MSRMTSEQMGAKAPSLRKAPHGAPAPVQVVRNVAAAADPGSSSLPIGHEMTVERVEGGAIVQVRKIGDYSTPSQRRLVSEAELARMLPKGD